METHEMITDCDRGRQPIIQRPHQWWMTLTRRQIDELKPFEWRAYKDGECICCASTNKECACGARFK
jgi:hypothetical protein